MLPKVLEFSIDIPDDIKTCYEALMMKEYRWALAATVVSSLAIIAMILFIILM
jgi:hypothetical protein